MRHYRMSEFIGSSTDIKRNSEAKKWISNAIKGEMRKSGKSLWRNSPSSDFAVNRRISTIRRLSRRQATPEIKLAINRLTRCATQQRCCSAACHECVRLFQRAFVRAVARFIRKGSDDKERELVAITIISKDAKVRPGELRNFDIQNFVRRLKTKLRSANIEIAIGGVDFSFNEDEDGLYEAHWSPHVHLVGWTTNESTLKAALKKQFPTRDIAVSKPTRVERCDGGTYVISYQYKVWFKRRVTYYDPKKGCRRTRRRPPKLTSDQKVELALYLNKVGLGARLLSIGLRPYVSRGRLRLKRLRP